MDTKNIFKRRANEMEFEDLSKQKEYTLSYFFGVWLTAEVIWASDDREAIFDANDAMKTTKLNYRLCQGKRIVKEWNNAKYNNY